MPKELYACPTTAPHYNMVRFVDLIGRTSSVNDMAESKRIKGLMDENEKLKAKIEILTQENRKFVCEIMFLLYLMKQKDHQDKR